MKFKKLTLIGFKSFADKTEIQFGEGITGIVGPNGCGKSNVADAVRWVLGEQSAKLLRGSSMQDVIFNGTERRKAQSYAEVALTFDNHNKSLFPSCDYEEVVISRKIFRSNESEYYLNGSLCRLRDINEMIRDAGFAIEGYTVIGQGRVMEIVNSKPEDRRSIFEEAAGISKYKHKKIEAERRMAKTRANLEQVDLILEHDRQTLGPLSRQAEKTRNYLNLKNELKHHEINLYINRFETAAETKANLSAAISAIEADIAANQKDYLEAVESYNAAVAGLSSIESDLDKYRIELTELSVDKEKISGNIKLYQQQLEGIRGQNESLMTANAVNNDNYDRLAASVSQKQNELATKIEQLRAVNDECGVLNADYQKITERVMAEESRLNEARKAMLAAMERRAAINRSMGELTAERTTLTEQVAELKERIDDTQNRLNALLSELDVKIAELDKLRSERDQLVSLRESEATENVSIVTKIKSLAADMNSSQQELSALLSRKKVFEDVRRDAYTHAVRMLTEDAKKDIRLNSAIMGVVGQVITVKEGFEAAVDNALGNAVNNIITKTEDDAKLLVEHLKANRYGRATFLPISSFKPRSLDKDVLPLLNHKGCFGVATDVITFDPVFAPVMKGLLGATVIVDCMDTAIALARAGKFSFRIVTLDGDIVSTQGAITGGSKKSDTTNVFTHERLIKELSDKANAVKAEIDRMAGERSQLSDRSDGLALHIKELAGDIHDYEIADAAKTAEIAAIKNDAEILKSSLDAERSNLEQTEKRLEDTVADLDAIEKTEKEAPDSLSNEETAKSDRELSALRAERDRLHECVSAANVRSVELTKDTETLRDDIVRIKNEMSVLSQNVESNNMTVLCNNRAMEELDEKIRQLASSASDGNEKRYNEISSKIDGLSDYKTQLNTKRVQSDEARMRFSERASELTERKHEQEIVLAQVDVNMDMMAQRVSDEYGLAYEACLEYKVNDYDPEVGEIEITKLRRRLAALGSINENAIEEARELSQRVGQMSAQRDDLVKSIADEEQIIREMSAKMTRDFDTCFEQIRKNFRAVFIDLFRGGNADLELTENEDPLARGVEIKAQPPSKNLQSITLLSGGEKTLTAIAILVAIMKLRPMPFCLLDEIEAALDDANVGRVAKTLKVFSSKTQVIAITHRKPTMEEADALYGVTMEEKGVSKIVSVKLADAIEQAETVTAED